MLGFIHALCTPYAYWMASVVRTRYIEFHLFSFAYVWRDLLQILLSRTRYFKQMAFDMLRVHRTSMCLCIESGITGPETQHNKNIDPKSGPYSTKRLFGIEVFQVRHIFGQSSFGGRTTFVRRHNMMDSADWFGPLNRIYCIFAIVVNCLLVVVFSLATTYHYTVATRINMRLFPGLSSFT